MRKITSLNPLVFLIPIVALGLALRLNRLDFQPLWFDEGYSVYFSTTDLATTTMLTAQDIHPPLYYYLLGVWIRVFGLTDVNLRLFSVAVGTATIPFVFLSARNLFNRTSVALVSAFLLAISPMHIYYSQEVRMYALVTFLVSISLYFFAKLLNKGRSSGYDWLGFVMASIFAIYTQYYASFLLAALALFFVIKRKSFVTLWKGWWISLAAIVFAFFPWAAFAGFSLVKYVGGKVEQESYSPLNPFSYLVEPLLAFSNGNTTFSYQLLGLVFVGLAALALVGPRLVRNTRSISPDSQDLCSQNSVQLSLLMIAIPLFLGWLVNLKFAFHPEYWERLFLFSLLPFLFLVAVGMNWLSNHLKRALIPALIVLTAINTTALNGFYTIERYANNDYRPLVKLVGALSRPDDLVLTIYPWQVGFFQTYLQSEWPRLYLAPVQQWADKPRLLTNELGNLTETHDRVWFPAYQVLGQIMETKVEEFFTQREFPVSENWFGDSRLFLFSNGEPPSAKEKLVNFDNSIRLLNYQMTGQKVESGRDSVQIILNWRATRRLQEKYTVNLRLVDEDNHTWAQRDSEPVAGHYPTDQWDVRGTIEDRHGLLIPAGTPAGEYEVKLGLTAKNGRLNLLDENNAPAGQEVSLGKVTVFPSTFRIPIDALFIEHPLSKDMGDGVNLLGYSGGETKAKPGTITRLSVFWQAARNFTEEALPVYFWLENGSGVRYGEKETKAVSGRYPTEKWTPGELVRDQEDILLPANLPDGNFTLMVSIGQKVTGTSLYMIEIQGRAHDYEKPGVSVETALKFGEFVELIGYDVKAGSQDTKEASPSGPLSAGEAHPGDTVTLTLYWHVTGGTSQNLATFAHLLGPSNQMIGQRDSVPGNGTLPTTSWVDGEYLVDSYEIATRPDAPAADLGIEVGMYNPTTGQRLSIQGKDGANLGDSQIIGKLKIVPKTLPNSVPAKSPADQG